MYIGMWYSTEGADEYNVPALYPRAWGKAALLVGRSRDRSPVVSLGIFSEASDKSNVPSKNE